MKLGKAVGYRVIVKLFSGANTRAMSDITVLQVFFLFLFACRSLAV